MVTVLDSSSPGRAFSQVTLKSYLVNEFDSPRSAIADVSVVSGLGAASSLGCFDSCMFENLPYKILRSLLGAFLRHPLNGEKCELGAVK